MARVGALVLARYPRTQPVKREHAPWVGEQGRPWEPDDAREKTEREVQLAPTRGSLQQSHLQRPPSSRPRSAAASPAALCTCPPGPSSSRLSGRYGPIQSHEDHPTC